MGTDDQVKDDRSSREQEGRRSRCSQGQHLGFEDLIVMAFAVLQRGNQTSKKFDDWANQLESVELVGIDETDFTETALSEEPSPILPSKGSSKST
jgi:hypothetical protein